MAKLYWKNFLKGIAPLDILNNASINVFGASENVLRIDDEELTSGIYTASVSPYRILNVLTPPPGKTNVTNMSTITDTIRHIVPRNQATPEAYAIGSGDGTAGSVGFYKLTGDKLDTVTAVGSSGVPSFFIDVTKNGYDIIPAYLNEGNDLEGNPVYKEYILYTHDRGGSAPIRKLGIYDFSGAGFAIDANDPNWGAITETDEGISGDTATFMPIEYGSDGNYWIGHGYTLSKLDPSITVVSDAPGLTKVAKTIPSDYVIKTMRDYRGQLVIGAHLKQGLASNSTRGKCAFFFWDYSLGFFNDIVYVDDPRVGSLYVLNGVLYTWTGEGDGYSKLRYFDGTTFQFLCGFSSGLPLHNSPDSYKNMLIWPATSGSGKVWTYGSPHPAFPPSLQQPDLGCTGTIKILTVAASGYFYHTSGSATLKVSDTGYADDSVWQSVQRRLPAHATIKKFTFEFLPLASGATLTCSYAKNNSATFTTIGTISFALDGAKTRKTFIKTVKDVDNVAIKLTWGSSTTNTVGITSIEIDYEVKQT